MLHLWGRREVGVSPAPITVPTLIDFYTEVQLRTAQVAFTYLHKMTLKRFKERPLLYSCLSTAAGSASGLGFGMDFALY